MIGRDDAFTARFDLPVKEDEIYLSRTHPITESLASWVLDTALDDVEAIGQKVVARRCGVTRTTAVKQKTTLLIIRLRYHLMTKIGNEERTLLAEEIRPLAFHGSPSEPKWLAHNEADSLLAVPPSGNVLPSMMAQQLDSVISRLPTFEPWLAEYAKTRANDLLVAHTRVRQSAKLAGSVRVEPILPVDLLGCFVLLPNG